MNNINLAQHFFTHCILILGAIIHELRRSMDRLHVFDPLRLSTLFREGLQYWVGGHFLKPIQ